MGGGRGDGSWGGLEELGGVGLSEGVGCEGLGLQSLRSVVLKEVDSGDPVTHGLVFVFRLFHVHLNVPLWSQYTSLIFVGALITVSLRGFLSNLMKVHNPTPFYHVACLG